MPTLSNPTLTLLMVLLAGGLSFPAAAADSADSSPAGPRHTWKEPVTGMEFVWVEGGCFEMGSPPAELDRDADETRHRLCVDGLWVGRHEVTNAQFRMWKPDHASGYRSGHSLNGDDQPVVEVDWHDAVGFARWLSSQGNGEFRLPTEAEWEYAARGGSETARPWGDGTRDACRHANVFNPSTKSAFGWDWEPFPCEDGHRVTAPVGSLQPNAFGLHDLLGNALEWTCSAYESYDDGSEKVCAESATYRVVRGGGWNNGPSLVRSANRRQGVPSFRYNHLGFRLVSQP
ncbi:MAG: formylglycine-generating enzyme family protein [Magnetococcales bacterium]|nr:formylglycine-generating enzyme family protein [Magnetococcales bacterium]